jgi:long-chain acyl-CoA synthetase
MVDALATPMLSAGTSVSEHFFELLFKQVQLVPNNVALVYENQHITYEQLLQRVSAVGEQLQKVGVGPNDKVAILFPNHPDYVASFFAAAGIGATIVPINPLLKSDEIAHILKDSDAKTLIVHEASLAEALKSQSTNPVLERIFVSGKYAAPANTTIKIEALTQGKKSHKAIRWHQDFKTKEDLALIVYTSGTTGKPKGAMLTHFSMLSIFPARFDIFEVDQHDVTLATLPMCHIYGIAILMIGTLSRGAKLVLMPKFEAAPVLNLIQQERITLVPAVPAMFQFMLLELEKNSYDLSSVRICFSGAAPLPKEVILAVEEKFGAVLIEGFGMTETSCVATINPLRGDRKVGSVGPPLPGVYIRVIADDGTELPAGPENVGELVIKGPNIMLGYYKQPEATEESIRDGWFATGDLCYRDEDDYFYIVGRKKEMIIRGGANIYPREIEDVILQLDEVAEVAVVGVPDKFMGERVKAVIVLKNGRTLSEAAIKEYCNEKLAEYKVPRIVEFRDAIPRNSTGKILKRMLTEQAQ